MSDYLPPYYPIIDSQGSFVDGIWKEPSSCVGHAISYLKEVQEYKFRGISGYRFDYVWIYGNRNIDDWQGEGEYPAQAIVKMQTDGVPKLDTNRAFKNTYTTNLDVANYDSAHLTAKDYASTYRSQLLAEAQTRRFTNSYTATLYTDTIKNGIIANGGVLIEFWLTDDTYNARFNGGIITDIYSTPYTTTHLICAIGWKNINGIDYWICPNSWGSWSGNNGIFYMPFNYTKSITCYIVSEITPSIFAWSTTFTSGNSVNVKASDWNLLTSKINSTRISKGLSTITFTNVISGVTPISASIFNEALSGFVGLTYSGTLPSSQVMGNSIYPNYFYVLRDCLNSVV